MTDTLVAPAVDLFDDAMDTSLRPRRLDEFVGQARLREHLQIMLSAAKLRGQALDHVLLAGPPGLGKTSLAGILAHEMGARVQATSGPALERPGDLAAILTNVDDGGVLFIDEVHRLPRMVEEVLYPAMEDFQLDIVIGKGPSARAIRLDLPRFTLVGATTRTGLITGPLRDRFGFVARLDYYTVGDLTAIVIRAAHILGVNLDPDAAVEIARRSRGTPRIANRLLKRVRDCAEVRADGHVTAKLARDALGLFEVDERGLDKVDRAILTALCRTFANRPLGLGTLSVAGRHPKPSPRSTSRTCCSAASSNAPHKDGSRHPPRSRTSASHHHAQRHNRRDRSKPSHRPRIKNTALRNDRQHAASSNVQARPINRDRVRQGAGDPGYPGRVIRGRAFGGRAARGDLADMGSGDGRYRRLVPALLGGRFGGECVANELIEPDSVLVHRDGARPLRTRQP